LTLGYRNDIHKERKNNEKIRGMCANVVTKNASRMIHSWVKERRHSHNIKI
jgi:hypothetical protein